MATYKLYDIGTVSDNTYMYKGVYRVGTQLSSVASYELLIVRFNLSDGSIDPNYGQQQQGAFRAHFQIKPNTFPLDLSRLCPGIMFDADNKLTFAGIAWMSGLARHGFFIAKLDSTGNLSNYGSGNYGVSVGGFDTNIYSCTKELLVDKSNNCVFGASTREYTGDVYSPSYISRRNSSGDTDNNFGNNGKVEISQTGFTPQITSLTFDNYGNYYVGYNALKNDGAIFGNSYIKSYDYSGSENTYFSTNGKITVDAGANFAAESPQDLGSIVRDQYLDDVKVFLTMNGEDGTTTLSDVVGGETIRFNGTAKISTDNKKFGASSLRLDGTNNSYLSIGTNNVPSDIPLANKDFCIEAMLYLDAVDDGRRILSLGGNTDTTGLLIESLNSGDNLNSLRVMMGSQTTNTNVVNLVAKNSLVEKTWQHFAYARKDNNVYLYVDGELKAAAHYNGEVNLGNAAGTGLRLGADQNGENGMIGNIDDFRLTIGNSRYFNAFKVPENQISSVGKSSDVKLLLHFEGDNNSKTVIDRGVSKISNCSCIGNAEISSDKHKFGGTSLKLDGTNSLVEVPDSKINWPATFYTNPFTIEGHFNFSNNTASQMLFKKNNSLSLLYTNNNRLKLRLTNTSSSASEYEQAFTPSLNRWYHIALVKSGVNITLYVDGQKLIVATFLSNLSDGGASSPWDFGGNRAGSADYFNGHIDEVRIVSSAVYTDVFTPDHHQFYPTQEHVITTNDNYQDQNKLLLHFEEANGSNLVDSSNNDTAVTLQNGTLNSDNARFGSKSLYVPASGKGANIAGLTSNATDIGNGNIDYTIEMYIKLNQIKNNAVLFTTDHATDQHLSITLKNNGAGAQTIEALLQHGSGVGSHIHTIGAADISSLNNDGNWHHLALVRKSQKVKLYIDGVNISNTLQNVGNTINGPFILGKDLDGYIDELRITDGVARYSGNFTPQTSAFGSEPVPVPEPQYKTADYSKSELLLRFDDLSTNPNTNPVDSSTNNRTVTSVDTTGSGGRNSNISKFGGQSWHFNAGTNDRKYLEVTSTAFQFGTDEFCVEFWYYPTAMVGPKYQKLICNSHLNPADYDNSGVLIGLDASNRLFACSCNKYNGSSPIDLSIIGPNMSPYLNKWNHIALCRDNSVAGDKMTLYLNGDSVATTNLGGSGNVGASNQTIRIGGYATQLTNLDDHTRGYIDEVHIRRGDVVYTSNFVPQIHSFGKTPISYTEPTPYFNAKSELAYMLPKTQTSSFLAVAKKTNSDNTTYAEVLNIKHDGKYLDTWGSDGKLALTVPGYSYINPETMWMDRELNLYVGGSAQKISNGLKDGVVWKIMPSGVVDATFGNAGVDIKDNTTLDESITSMYNDYSNNKMIYTSLFTGDTGVFTNAPMMSFNSYNFGGDLNFLSSYNYITKETTPNEGLNRVLQDMGLTNAAHIKMPASMFNNLLGTYNETTNKFPVTDIVLNVDQSANDNITVVSGGLIKDFWNYFIAKIETIIPANKRNLWDDAPSGANGYTDTKLQNFFRDVGLGTLTVPKVNDVIREYEANTNSLFPHRVKPNGAPHHRRDGFIAGDKAGINAGVQITFQTTISAATGGTANDTVISETRTFNVLLELE